MTNEQILKELKALKEDHQLLETLMFNDTDATHPHTQCAIRVVILSLKTKLDELIEKVIFE